MTVRRVVTGHNERGRAVVLSDDRIAGKALPDLNAAFAVVWTTVTSPVDNDDATDRAQLPIGLTQPGGSVLRVVELGPGSCSPMHRTDSLDYGIVLDGDVELELDDGAITPLRAGDIVVQRGTMHAWLNRSATPAHVAFILLDATPATAGGRPLSPVMDDIAPH